MKNTIIAIVLAGILFPATVYSQLFYGTYARQKVRGAEVVRMSETANVPSYIKFSNSAQPDLKNLAYWMNTELGVSSEMGMQLISTEQDLIGMNHYRYQQTFNGTPLNDATFIVHTKNSKIVSISGVIHKNIHITNSTALSPEASLEKAINYIGASLYMWQSPSDEQWIKQYERNPEASYLPKGTLVILQDGVQLKYAWKFDIYAKDPLSRQDVFVDASSGKILESRKTIHTTDVPGQAVTKYSLTRTITVDSTAPGQYRLRETGRGNGIQTWDMNQGTNYSAAVDFTDADNYWNNTSNQDNVAGDAHWSSEKTYDYFYTKFGRNSIDGNGFALLSYVHYDANYANAFWDGQRMTYGDGNGSMSAFTTVDICAHEITHGLTTNTADLVYADESGALSEGYSDIFGTAVEFYAKPPLQTGNWTEGEDIGQALRDIANPNATQNPDTYLGTYWDPGMEVHQNSTVLSHWFYLVAQGGSGTNDMGNAFNVSGLGIDDAAAVAFRTLTVYLSPSSGYADARFYSIVSATDLFGGCSAEVEAVTNAWYACGVGGVYVPTVVADFSADFQTFCSAPVTVNFVNNTTNGQTYKWDFGDGSTSTLPNPSHTYNSNGNYDVKLVADGGSCGKDSLTNVAFISIDAANSNIASMPASGTGATLTCCTGSLFDSGGENGDYANNTNGKITIAPTGAATVTLTFTEFDFEASYDYLYIYDGPTTASPLIGQYDGTALPNGGVIHSTGGSLTLKQITDQGLVKSGFRSTWQCNMPNSAPLTNFTANVTSTCTGIVQFTDHSTNAPVNWQWDFGDGTYSSQQNPLHAYTTSGTFTVSMTAGNSFGSDIETKTNYITVNLPPAPTVTGGSVCDSGQVTLTASGSGTLDWYDAALGGNFVGTGNTFITPVISATTVYYVEDKHANPSVYGGKTNKGTGGYYGNQNNIHYLIFDAFVPFNLVSVKVFANGTGNRTILLRNSSQSILQSLTVNVPDGESRVTLNFSIPAGTGLQLVGDGYPDLWRDNNGAATYPYTTTGIFSITQSSASLPPYNVYGNYYYFYDWEVQEPTCISARIPDTALVYPCGSVQEITSISGLHIFPNPASEKLTITFTSSAISDALLTIQDVTGRTIFSEPFITVTGKITKVIDVRTLARGIYFVELKSPEGSTVQKIVKD